MSAKYKIVCDSIQQDIESGKYNETGKLPTEDELIILYRVSRNTIRKAVDLLVKRGAVMPIQGSGIFAQGAHRRVRQPEVFTVSPPAFAESGLRPRSSTFNLLKPTTNWQRSCSARWAPHLLS